MRWREPSAALEALQRPAAWRLETYLLLATGCEGIVFLLLLLALLCVVNLNCLAFSTRLTEP